jgi:hypothetical protein
MPEIINPATVIYPFSSFNEFTNRLRGRPKERLPFVALRDGTKLAVYEVEGRGFKTDYKYLSHIIWSPSGHAFDDDYPYPNFDMVSMYVPEGNDPW